MAKRESAATEHHGESLRRFMREHPPFDRLPEAELQFLLSRGQLVFYTAGSVLLSPTGAPVEHFFMVYQGRVQGLRHDAQQDHVQFEIGLGECFPLAALMGERPTHTEHIAVNDTFCLRWSRDDFAKLVRESEPFREFALGGVSGLMVEVDKQMQQRAAGQLGSDFSMMQPISGLLQRRPIFSVPEAALSATLAQMEDAHVSSIVIIDSERRPIGIFTLRDLRRRLAHQGWLPDAPISAWMTPNPITVEHDLPVFQAALVMAEKGITHVVVCRNGRLLGVLSERDLFALQRLNLVSLGRDIRYANSLQQLQASRADLAKLVDQLLARGAQAHQITQLIARLNDQIVQRVISLVSASHGVPERPFTWLCFGSEAREEQALHTDQDNGLWFDAEPDETEAVRQQFLPWANEINTQLDRLGLMWCTGGIMAGQPACCLSAAEWRQRFAKIIHEPTPEKVLQAVIFFDMRVVQGDSASVDLLRQNLLEWTQQRDIFRRILTEDALRRRPPLGQIRDFRLSRGGDNPNTFDIKTEALAPIVEAARVLSLAHGVSAVSTTERLRGLAAVDALRGVDAAAYEEAFQHLQLMRLQLHQEQQRAGKPMSNRLNPDHLNPLDRRILRECLRQVQRLQRDMASRVGL